MEPITVIIAALGTTVVVGLGVIARQERVRKSAAEARVAKAKERAVQKAASKELEFQDTRPTLPPIEYGNKMIVSDDRHLGFAELNDREDNIITAIFDDSLAPPLNVKPAYTVHGSFVDNIFDERNITETIEPKF